jgi:galactokinase
MLIFWLYREFSMRVVFSAQDAFSDLFSTKPPQFEVFAPGRVNLIGEHTDYNGGKVLPFAISLGVTLRVRMASCSEFGEFAQDVSGPLFVVGSDVSPDVFVVSESGIRDHMLRKGILEACESDSALVPKDVQASWAKYVLGSLVVFFEAVKGRVQLPENSVVAIEVSSTLPVGSGLSSSAALSSGLISALCFVFGKHLSANSIARLAMTVEHRFAGTKCGLMDQLAVMTSQAGHFTNIHFSQLSPTGFPVVSKVKAHHNFDEYTAVAFHTGVAHSLANTEYNKRRAECERALAILNAHTKRQMTSLGDYSALSVFKETFHVARENAKQSDVVVRLTEIFVSQGTHVDEAKVLSKRAAHAILENARVDCAMHALQHGELQKLDAVLQESHESLNSDYEVSCSELNAACEIARGTANTLARAVHLSVPAILGPRMTGGGFGGSTVQFVHNSILEKFVETFRDGMNPYSRKTGSTPRLIVSQPQNGLRITIV